MVDHSVVVSRPEKTKIQSVEGRKYVYAVVEQKYVKEKRMVVDKRVLIGRLCEDDPSKMHPNAKFYKMYPNAQIEEPEEEQERSDSVSVGLYCTVDKIMKDLQLDVILQDVHGEEESAVIQNLILYLIGSQSSELQHFSAYYFRHMFFGDTVHGDSYLSRFLKEGIQREDVQLFLEAWNKVNMNGSDVYIAYDSTNLNTMAEGIELAELGHAKEDEDKPIVNISTAMNQETGRPLMFEMYPGSNVDSTQLRYMVKAMQDYGYTKIGFTFDRGYYTKRNLDEFRDKYNCLMMVKINNKVIKEKIDEWAYKLAGQAKYHIKGQNLFGTTIRGKLFASDKKDSYIHLFFSPEHAEMDQRIFFSKIDTEETELEKIFTANVTKYEKVERFKKHFRFIKNPDNTVRSYTRNNDRIQKELGRMGYFCLVSTQKMTCEEALKIYRNRDVVEKFYRTMKSGMGFDKFGVTNDASAYNKTYVVFIASIIWAEMNTKLRVERENRNNRKDFTVPAAIAELDNIEVSRINKDGGYSRRYALTKKQKDILSVFGANETAVRSAAERLNKRLVIKDGKR